MHLNKKIEVDLTKGSILKMLIMFSLPLMFTQVLQQLFNTADTVVLGAFVKPQELADNSVAGVGATASLINLVIGLFLGLASGTNVMVARCLGEKNQEKVRRLIGISILISIVGGVILAFVGYFSARTILVWMNCDKNVLDLATKYAQIYFLGTPIVLLYNFCSSIMRASGDTKRPLIFLAIGGVLNVGLNVFFVVVRGKNVEGVAIATVASQAVASILCLISLVRSKGMVKLEAKYLRFTKEEFVEIFKIGIPAGIQGCLFALSNVILQSKINSFGENAMAGSAYATQIEHYIFYVMNSVSIGAMSFVSANLGAKKIDRVRKIVKTAVLLTVVSGSILGLVVIMLVRPIISCITTNQIVVDYAVSRTLMIAPFHFTCGIMEVFSNTLRSIGKSFTSMLISFCGVCVIRLLWIYTLLPFWNTYQMIFISYSVSWTATLIVQALMYFKNIKRIEEQNALEGNCDEQTVNG